MQWHPKGYFIKDFNKKGTIEIIHPNVNMVDLKRYLLQYPTDKIKEMDIKDIFDVDVEYIANTNDKVSELCNASASISEKLVNSSKEEKETDVLLLNYLGEKKVETKQTEINLGIAINNLEKIKGLNFSENGVKVYFESDTGKK